MCVLFHKITFSSDWDAEVREEEKAELMRLHKFRHSADEIYCQLANEDDDDDDDDVKMNDVMPKIRRNTVKLKDICESQSEIKTNSEDDNVLKQMNAVNSNNQQMLNDLRPKSTPFRSSVCIFFCWFCVFV